MSCRSTKTKKSLIYSGRIEIINGASKQTLNPFQRCASLLSWVKKLFVRPPIVPLWSEPIGLFETSFQSSNTSIFHNCHQASKTYRTKLGNSSWVCHIGHGTTGGSCLPHQPTTTAARFCWWGWRCCATVVCATDVKPIQAAANLDVVNEIVVHKVFESAQNVRHYKHQI